MSPSDPIKTEQPSSSRALFEKFDSAADGFPADAVITASINTLIFSLRACYGRRDQVIARYDDLMGKAKEALLKHYDATTNKRRSVIPFTQVVHAQLVKADDKVKG